VVNLPNIFVMRERALAKHEGEHEEKEN